MIPILKMLKLQVIERSKSEYSSPPVAVRKPDESCRYCIDFRRLNAVTTFDAEPLPNQEILLGKLGKSKYFTKIDLSKGFWQIPIKETDKHLTAFTTPQGLFQFRVMPFGLVNASAIFCRMVRKLLEGLDHVESYVDDLIVHTEDWDTHLTAVRNVFERLRCHGLTARPTKCEIGQFKVQLLGHVVGEKELSPQKRTVEKILDVSRPETKKELRSFLGVVGYYRKFIPNFADVAKPLTDLTGGKTQNVIQWSEEAEEAYGKLKKEIAKYPVLRLPQLDKTFILATDASDKGISAVLMQEHGDGKFPVIYISRKLNPAETRYSTIEKECLALVWAIKKFQAYLYGREFILETDHQPLKFINKHKIDNDRIMRWALGLQPYRYVVRVVKGKDNLIADYLSRHI